MNEFASALLSDRKNELIPESQNFWGGLIGEWDFEWIDHPGTSRERHMIGEWIFSWVLNGTAIQDLFILPSRAEIAKGVSCNQEYGTTIRFYSPKIKAWEIFYGCTLEATRLQAREEGDNIVLTELNDKNMKWIFSEIQENSFQWQNIMLNEDGNWSVYANVFARRKDTDSRLHTAQ